MQARTLGERARSFLRALPRRTASPVPEAVSPNKPALSIVIPAFNEAGYIADTLEAVLEAKKRYAGSVEVIVVDNNSSDATGEIARSFGVIVVFEPINQIARAKNAGARTASGDVLVFLDADTIISGDILDIVAKHLSSGRVIGGGAWVEPDTGWFGRLFFKYVINYVLGFRNVTPGPFLFCERAAFENVWGFDEDLYAAEEFSLARRLKAEGCKSGKIWKIIRYGQQHRLVTSGRKFSRFGGLEMAVHNAHLLWNPHQKVRDKSQCTFWYEARKTK